MNKKRLTNFQIEVIFVVLIVGFGFLIRAFHFGATPIGIHQDEAMAAVDAKALAEYGTDRFGMRYPVHFTAWTSSQMSVLLSYCMIPFIKLLGFSAFSIRLPMLVVSSIALLALYFLGRQVGGKWLGMLCLILGVICPWQYMQSRWSFDCNMFPHFFLFGMCLLLIGLKKKWCLYVSMALFGLCSYCYGIANYTVPLFLIAAAVYLLCSKQVNLKQILGCVIVYLLVALPEFLTMLINTMGWETIETPFFTIPYFPASNRSNDILLFHFSWEQLWINIVWMLRTSFWNGDSSVTNTVVKFGPTYYITTFFFVIGFVILIQKIVKTKEIQEKTPYILILLWMLMALWAGVVTREVTIHRINIIFYPILIIASIGILWCIQKCKILLLPIAGVYAVLALSFAQCYFGEWADLSRIYYYESYTDALYYAKTLPCDYYYITPDPQGENVAAVGEILTLYCHEIDALYYQGKTNIQDGKEVLPFNEKYHIQGITNETLKENEDKSVVYIVNAGELSEISTEGYVVDSFYDEYFVLSKSQETAN